MADTVNIRQLVHPYFSKEYNIYMQTNKQKIAEPQFHREAYYVIYRDSAFGIESMMSLPSTLEFEEVILLGHNLITMHSNLFPKYIHRSLNIYTMCHFY